jgi:hypothetical protein
MSGQRAGQTKDRGGREEKESGSYIYNNMVQQKENSGHNSEQRFNPPSPFTAQNEALKDDHWQTSNINYGHGVR